MARPTTEPLAVRLLLIATALGVSMLVISFAMLLVVNGLQRSAGRHRRAV